MTGLILHAPEVRTVLDTGRVVVRRAMKHQPSETGEYLDWHEGPYDWRSCGQTSSTEPFQGSRPMRWFLFESIQVNGMIEHLRPAARKHPTKRQAIKSGEWLYRYHKGRTEWSEQEVCGLSPFGVPGERRFVKEPWWESPMATSRTLRDGADTWPEVVYDVDCDNADREQWREFKWVRRSSANLQEELSRLTLTNVATRVEKLKESVLDGAWVPWGDRDIFRRRWDSAHRKPEHKWAANPHVWVGEFKRAEPC